jgi:predicted nucleic acid-binding protein
VRFWDSSALAALLLPEERTGAALALLDEDPEVAAWWGTPVECASAVSRAERNGRLGAAAAATVLDRLDRAQENWSEVLPSESLRRTARRLLRVHPLRAADSLQLAAALAISEGSGPPVTFVTLDGRLAEAARREGLPVLVPA